MYDEYDLIHTELVVYWGGPGAGYGRDHIQV